MRPLVGPTTYTDRATALGRAPGPPIRGPPCVGGCPESPTPDHKTRLARRSAGHGTRPRLGRLSFPRRFSRDRRKRPKYNEKTAVSPGAIPECEHRQDGVAEGAVSSEPVSPRIWASARRVLNPRLCPALTPSAVPIDDGPSPPKLLSGVTERGRPWAHQVHPGRELGGPRLSVSPRGRAVPFRSVSAKRVGAVPLSGRQRRRPGRALLLPVPVSRSVRSRRLELGRAITQGLNRGRH